MNKPKSKPKFKKPRVKIDRTPLGEINTNVPKTPTVRRVATDAVLERYRRMKEIAKRPGSTHEGIQARKAIATYKKKYILS